MPKNRGKCKPEWRAQPQRQTRARSRMTNAVPLMAGLNQRGQASEPLPAEARNISYNEALQQDLLTRPDEAAQIQARERAAQVPKQRRGRKLEVRRQRAQSNENPSLQESAQEQQTPIKTEEAQPTPAASQPETAGAQETRAQQPPQHQAELEPKIKTEQEPETHEQPERSQSPQQESKPEKECQQQQGQDAQPDQNAESDAENEQETESGSSSDSEANRDPEQDPDPDCGHDSEHDAEPEPEAEAETVGANQNDLQPEPTADYDLSQPDLELTLAQSSTQPDPNESIIVADQENKRPIPGLGANVPPLTHPATGFHLERNTAPRSPTRNAPSHEEGDISSISEAETEILEEVQQRKRRRDLIWDTIETSSPKRQRTPEQPATIKKLETQEARKALKGTKAPPPTPSQGRPAAGGLELPTTSGDWSFDRLLPDIVDNDGASEEITERPPENILSAPYERDEPSAEDELGRTASHNLVAALEPSDAPPLGTTDFPHATGMVLGHQPNGMTAIHPGSFRSLPSEDVEYDPAHRRTDEYDPVVESLSGGSLKEQAIRYRPDHDNNAKYDPERPNGKSEKTVSQGMATI